MFVSQDPFPGGPTKLGGKAAKTTGLPQKNSFFLRKNGTDVFLFFSGEFLRQKQKTRLFSMALDTAMAPRSARWRGCQGPILRQPLPRHAI
jgi:hypothetical protein